MTAAGIDPLCDEYTRTIEPARALAVETSKLERALSDLVNQAFALTRAEITLMWKTAPPSCPSRHRRLPRAHLALLRRQLPRPRLAAFEPTQPAQCDRRRILLRCCHAWVVPHSCLVAKLEFLAMLRCS